MKNKIKNLWAERYRIVVYALIASLSMGIAITQAKEPLKEILTVKPLVITKTIEVEVQKEINTTEERFFEAIETDVNFRAYVVNMIVNNNNPGNLRCASQPYSTCVNGFASFPDTITGFRALIMQLELDAERGDTIITFLEDYAPRAENHTDQYIQTVADEMFVPKTTPLKYLDLLHLATIIVGCEHSLWY